ncbi:hypothetical protein ACJJTC_004925 [Scirpophaga incertulas]
MFSKLLRGTAKQWIWKMRGQNGNSNRNVRQFSDLIPPTQYDTPLPRKMHLTYVLKEYWETIPLFLTTCTAMTILFLSIASAFRNKVDAVYTSHSRECISRTMNLNYPSVHKLVTINQRYEPWPEMQDLQDKMKAAEKRVLARMQSCGPK